MNRPCFGCGSAGNGDPGVSRPESICRLCGRAWSEGLPDDAAWPEIAWWVVFEPEDADMWDPDNTTGHGGVAWSLYESELAEPVMMFVAAGSTRSEVLHLLDMILTVIAERRLGLTESRERLLVQARPAPLGGLDMLCLVCHFTWYISFDHRRECPACEGFRLTP